MDDNLISVFRPKFSFLWDLMLVLIFLLCFDLWLIFEIGKEKLPIGNIFDIFLPRFICMVVTIYIIYIILMIFSYPTMCYIFYKDRLILKCGFYKSTIFYSQIKNVSQREHLHRAIVFGGGTPVRSMTPGHLLLGSFYFFKYGWITLYATRPKDFIIIETEKKRYGITPQDKNEFLTELNRFIKK